MTTGSFAWRFDRWVEYYDSDPEVRLLRSRIDFTRRRTLEVGCGSGRLTSRIAPDRGEYVAIDVDPRLVRYCKRERDEVADGLSVAVVDAGGGLPMVDDSFDVVLDGWAFAMVGRPDVVAREYRRVLRPGGRLVMLAGRDGSDYHDVLRSVSDSGYSFSVEETIEAPLAERFGEPVEKREFESRYVFSSVAAAYEAFLFHTDELASVTLSDEQRATLESGIERYEREDGTIKMAEYTVFFEFTSD